MEKSEYQFVVTWNWCIKPLQFPLNPPYVHTQYIICGALLKQYSKESPLCYVIYTSYIHLFACALVVNTMFQVT